MHLAQNESLSKYKLIFNTRFYDKIIAVFNHAALKNKNDVNE